MLLNRTLNDNKSRPNGDIDSDTRDDFFHYLCNTFFLKKKEKEINFVIALDLFHSLGSIEK